MSSLTNFSMKNVAAVIIMMLMLFIGGTYAASVVKMELMPSITLKHIYITTQYTAPPKDVLELVTKPIEKAVAGLDGIKNLKSTSSDNFSTIEVELLQGKKIEDAKREAESLLVNVKLPQGAEKPKVQTTGSEAKVISFLSMYGENDMSQQELDKIFKDIIKPGFSKIKGIDRVDGFGNKEAILTLKLNSNAIANYGLTPRDVSQSIQSAILSSPAGLADFNGNSLMVRIKSDLDTIFNLENMKITAPGGETLLLKDIAKVEAISESRFFSRLDGKSAIGITISKVKGANDVKLTDEADALIATWKQQYPNITIKSLFVTSGLIKESIHGMVKEGVLGALLASIMILLFLRNVRMTIIVLVSIPLSLLITLLVMAPLDISLNIMTLGGITIAIGRVVDDSIVVIENIYSELVKVHERGESVIKKATVQVSSAITSSTLTTAGVFAPIGFVSGEIGDIFRPFAITLSVALLASLLVAVTVIPMLAKLLVLRSKNIKVHDETQVGKVSGAYLKALKWSLNNRMKTMLLSLLVFVVTIAGTVPFLAMEMMPASNSDKQVQFSIKMPRETSFASNDLKMKEIEAMMREMKNEAGEPAYEYMNSYIGGGSSDNRLDYLSQLLGAASQGTNAKKLLNQTKEKILYLLPKGSEVDGVVLGADGGGGGADFIYMLKGDDSNLLKQGAKLVKEKLKEIPEFRDIKDSLSESKNEVEVAVDQNKARLYNLSSGEIVGAVNSWLREEKIGDLKFDNTTFSTKIMLDKSFKNSIDKIGNFLIKTPSGTTVKLNEVAKIRQIEAPAEITRDQQVQYVQVTAKIESKDKGGVSAKAAEMLQSVELPSGVRVEVKGASEDIQKNFTEMFVAMIGSVFIVYLLLVLTFGNASAPFAILFSLPLAAIGGLLGLILTGESLNLTSLIGFLMLIGVVVTNAIVLIERVQQLEEEGKSVRDSLVLGGLSRLRPIIMTAGATIVTLMPLALGFSKGAIISKGLAVVVIGGLTTSTVLTLIVVPVVYEMIYNTKTRLGRLFGNKTSESKSTPVTDA
ncbi:efflux RND transporter permease subunit [Paenibacillus sp. MZ04-78.2]|uniref:efflux RND transporter permease subunit n=1 Tax=Paenibacillus sp. MZ04-78.2 TaxID=2962034 RepID=UPI0020B68B4D|nr:efflux RND transporter permease subunit [Paenibacillus sp. MZ04-78.2]MCP3771889.1 efflux RND transporter permease subunit [Paenibacillus sp. MZ04-78.2]